MNKKSNNALTPSELEPLMKYDFFAALKLKYFEMFCLLLWKAI